MEKTKLVLTLNLGSTSLKGSLFHRGTQPDWSGPSHSISWPIEDSPDRDRSEMSAQENGDLNASSTIVDLLARQLKSWLSTIGSTPNTVVHRIVHGGTLQGPCFLSPENIALLSRISAWAPNHQTPALAIVDVTTSMWPMATQLAMFDTDWHRTLPSLTRTFAISQALRSEGLHKFGFHGLAFQSAWRQLCKVHPDAIDRRVVLAHLGGGSSLCAVRGGRSVDTTMGLTPLDGLPMATRCGSIDPGVIFHLLRSGRLSVSDLEAELNRNSGLLGISGTTGDMERLLLAETVEAKLAINIFVHRTAQGIASMATTLGGIDDLVFSGGIGMHSSIIRAAIVEQLDWIGLKIDPQANAAQEQRINASSSAASILVFEVYEDRELANALSPAP